MERDRWGRDSRCRPRYDGRKRERSSSSGSGRVKETSAKAPHGSDRHKSQHCSEYPQPKKRKTEPSCSYAELSPQTNKVAERSSKPESQPKCISDVNSYTSWTHPKLYYTTDGAPITATTNALHSKFVEKFLRNISTEHRLCGVTGLADPSGSCTTPKKVPECTMEEEYSNQLEKTASSSPLRPPNVVFTEPQLALDSVSTSLGSGEPMEVELQPAGSTKISVHGGLPCNVPSEGDLKRDYDHLKESNSPRSSYYCYSLETTPDVNFKLKTTTCTASSDGGEYKFKGFLLLSTTSLEQIPDFTFQRYGGTYKMSFKKQSLSLSSAVADLILLVEEYIFIGLLELYDWINGLRHCAREMLFLPCFARCKPSGDYQVLSVSEVLDYLLRSCVPLKNVFRGKIRDRSTYEAYGLLVSNPQKRPACIRVDRLEQGSDNQTKIVHFSSQAPRPNPTAEDEELAAEQAAQNALQRQRSRGKLKQKEFYELKELMQKSKKRSQQIEYGKEMVEVECEGFFSTGLYVDVVQHALVLPLVASHIEFHRSLIPLEDKLLYRFKDRQLFQRCLTHPSFTGSPFYGMNEQQVRNTMSNCGVKHPESLHHIPSSHAKSSDPLMASLERGVDESIRLGNSEQLEFLGDAVLELACSIHLFNMLPSDTVGQLTTYRRALVKNKHLSEIAATINLKPLIRKSDKMDLHEESLMRLAANSLEAIFGAIFLDGGFEEVDKLIARLFFPEKDLYQAWMKERVQPLQLRNEHGDRELVEKEQRLQALLPLEDSIGVKFTNICLLAQAFTHSSCTNTSLTMGNYQRMEYLGDAILQFLTSHYVYIHFPSQHEGHLSMLRTSLVHNKQLSRLCQQLGFKQYIITSTTEKVPLTGKILADVVESFLAALYLDKGMRHARCFLETALFPKLEDVIRNSELVDASVHLQQAVVYTCKKRKMDIELPIYRTLNVHGPPNKPEYTVAVYFREKRIGKGSGHSLREARKKAAENALTHNGGCILIPPLLQKTLQ